MTAVTIIQHILSSGLKTGAYVIISGGKSINIPYFLEEDTWMMTLTLLIILSWVKMSKPHFIVFLNPWGIQKYVIHGVKVIK